MTNQPIRVLWFTPRFPFPPDTGAKIHVAETARNISGRFQISLISLYNRRREKPPSEKDITEAKKYFHMVKTFPCDFPGKGGRLGKLFYAVFGRNPLYVANCTAAEAWPEVQRVVGAEKCRLVQADEIYSAKYLVSIPGIKKVLILHNVDSLMLWRSFLYHPNILHKGFFLMQAWKMRHYERTIIPKFDYCFCFSEVDKGIFERAFGGKVRFGVFSNGVDTKAKSILPKPDNQDLLFVGTFDYHPNALAVEWFLKEIFPLVLKKIPAVRFFAVGCHPPTRLKKWEHRLPVTFAGYAEDIEEWYHRTAITVVPVRIGSGTRGKILEAMAYGRPVVSTTVGAEGLKVTAGKDILIADRPEKFAGNVVSLLRDSELYKRVAVNARQTVEEKYDWKFIAADLEKSYSEILGDTKSSHS
ncbi:MAG: glycosyltransferase family 4 protein [Candidatus Omnitrophota bacterium]